jgi:hypothetical protein
VIASEGFEGIGTLEVVDSAESSSSLSLDTILEEEEVEASDSEPDNLFSPLSSSSSSSSELESSDGSVSM